MRRMAAALIAVAIVSASGATVASSHRSASLFVPVGHRKPPDLQKYGTASPKPLRIIAFVPSGYPHHAELADWPKAIVHSMWLARLDEAYHVPTALPPIGEGFVVSDMPPLPGHDATTRSVFDTWTAEQFLTDGISPLPGYQTIVILFHHCTPPESLDGFGCTSHHPSTTAGGAGCYALSLGNPTGTPAEQRDSLTEAASHELAEAITDTEDGWRLTTIDKDHPWAFVSAPNPNDPEHGLLATPTSSPFVEDEDLGTVESADMLSGSRWFENFTPTGFSSPVRYAYVRVFSKFGNDNRDDPGVPPSPDPYFNVTTLSDWYILHLGGTKTVTIIGWSTKKIPAWTVTSKVSTWTGSMATGGSTPPPAPCRLVSGTPRSVANGGEFTLKVSATNKVSAGEWCLVALHSSLVTPDPNGDVSHPWFVGFILEQ